MGTSVFHSVRRGWEVHVFSLNDPKSPFILKPRDDLSTGKHMYLQPPLYVPTLTELFSLSSSETAPISVNK